VINQYPEARIAITEDEDWMSVITQVFFSSDFSEACVDCLSQQDVVFPGPDELCTRLLAAREVSVEDGEPIIITYHMLLG